MIIVVGSRRNGNSLKLANLVSEELNKIRVHTEIIVPGNQKIHVCTGCMDCDKDGICDFTDDMKKNIGGKSMRVIVSGGGTGGHIYPALAIAERILEDIPGSEVLYIGW